MDLFIVSGGKRVIYKVEQPKEDIKVIKEKLIKKLSQKIRDIDIEINSQYSGKNE
jgi:hypothetical protein